MYEIPNDYENKLKVQLLIDIGDKYLNGIGFEKNYSKAINCYEKAAEFNDSDAFYKLGNIYLYGKGVSRNIEKANEYYEKSISLNNSQCLLHLAKIYFYGELVPKDKEKAIKYFERSAEQNNSTAILFLANFYLFSKNDNNLAKAKEYFELYSKTINIKFNKKLDYIKNNFSLNLCSRINWINEITSSLIYNCLGLIFLNESIENHESFESIAKKNTSIIYITIGNLYMFGQYIDEKALFDPNIFKDAVDLFDANNSFNTKYSFYDQKNVDLIVQIIFEEINFKGKKIGKNHFKAKKYYEKAAELNDPIALNNLGCLYYYGLGVGKNYKKSINFFEKAAKLKNLTAYNNLADIYVRRKGVEQNYSKAIEYYEISAKQNNLNAIKELGYIYFDGKTGEVNLEKAIEYFKLSAKMNDPEQIVFLGDYYISGNDFEKNYEKANECYEIAAKLNDFKAIVKLLFINIENKKGDKQKAEKAIEYVKSPIFTNYPSTYLLLGNLYLNGYYFDRDYSKAKECFEEAAKLKSSHALNILGNIYMYGKGVERNLEKAISYYKSSAKLGDSEAYVFLGILYSDAYRDYSLARIYFQKAAKFNNSNGYFYLGSLFYFGYGVKQSYRKAKIYFELAAHLGNSNAYFQLGNLYFSGKGVKKLYFKAKECYEKAAKLHNSISYYSLGILYYYGLGVQQSYSKALKYFKCSVKPNLLQLANTNDIEIFITEYIESKSINNINVFVYNYLGAIYLYELSVVKDVSSARYYFELAAKNGDLCASHMIAINFCFNENGELNIQKMLQCLELPINKKFSESLVLLGSMYLYGQHVEKDFAKAKYYLELANQKNHPLSYLYLGDIYYNGYGVDKDYTKFKYYLEIAAEKNVPQALLRLGYEYFTGKLFKVDIKKAQEYLFKCTNITENNILEGFKDCDYCPLVIKRNVEKYFSYNELGLIYLIASNDVNEAEKCIKEAALNEFPFGQNNFGLLNQFYLNNMEKAIHFFNRSSEHNFSLSFYNLGYFYEKIENDINRTVDFYIKASDYENEQMIFQGISYTEESLDISKIFILCFTNLKLVDYFLSKSEIAKSKKYFIKAFSKLYFKDENILYRFHLVVDINSIIMSFSYLKKFIMNFPPFNLKNQPNLNSKYFDLFDEKMDFKGNDDKNNFKSVEELSDKDLKINNNSFNEMNKLKKDDGNDDFNVPNDFNDGIDSFHHERIELIFEDPGEFFDFVVQNYEYKCVFIDEIKSIIQIMETILYTRPYSILFGRINIEKTRFSQMENSMSENMDINESFYEGFELEI